MPLFDNFRDSSLFQTGYSTRIQNITPTKHRFIIVSTESDRY